MSFVFFSKTKEYDVDIIPVLQNLFSTHPELNTWLSLNLELSTMKKCALFDYLASGDLISVVDISALLNSKLSKVRISRLLCDPDYREENSDIVFLAKIKEAMTNSGGLYAKFETWISNNL